MLTCTLLFWLEISFFFAKSTFYTKLAQLCQLPEHTFHAFWCDEEENGEKTGLFLLHKYFMWDHISFHLIFIYHRYKTEIVFLDIYKFFFCYILVNNIIYYTNNNLISVIWILIRTVFDDDQKVWEPVLIKISFRSKSMPHQHLFAHL